MSILRLEKRVETPGRKRVNFSSQKMLKDNNKKNRKKTKPLSNTATKKTTLVLSTSKKLLTRMGMHDGLLFKFLQNNVGGCLFLFNKQLIFSSTSTCPIKIDQNQTRSFPYARGVHRQSCILRPLLFSLFINNDIPVSFEETLFDPFVLPNGT